MKKVVFFILLSFSFLPIVSAESIWIDCPKEIPRNKEFECVINGYSSYEICALEYQFVLPTYVEKIDFQIDPVWQGGEYENKVVLYTEINKVGDFPIGTITLRTKKKMTSEDIQTTWLLFGDADLEDHILIDETVNELESEEENHKSGMLILLICGMMVIIGCLCIILFLKKRK